MERIILVNFVVLLTITLCMETALSVPHNYETAIEQDKRKNDDDKASSYLWFGPRLGRKKRNPGDEYRNTEVGRDEVATLLDILQDSPWAVVAVNEGKRHAAGFTPRLGRESGEDDRWIQETDITGDIMSQRSPSSFTSRLHSDLGGDLMSQRSPPFAPRLGRRFANYSPRLGMECCRDGFNL